MAANKERARRKETRRDSVARRGGDERGFAMLFVIFAIMVIGILGAAALLYTTLVLRSAVGVTPASRALSAAETGLDVVHALLASDNITESTLPGSPVTGTMWEGKGTYEVHVEKNPDMGDGDPYDWRITSYGEYTASVEGVERTFYRELEEVISFAGGRYYNAFDYVLFSKEGDIDVNLDGDFSALNVGRCEIIGQVYAGDDIILSDAAHFIGDNDFTITGNVITEHGDLVATNTSAAFASSDININGDIYTGILAGPGDVGGGVNLVTELGFIGGGSINVVGNINSSGRLKSDDYGVRMDNAVLVVGGSTTRIAGNIRSVHDVFGRNRVLAAGWPTLDIDGTIYCGENVTFSSELVFAGAMKHDINGSIYAAGDVTLYGYGFLAGTLYNRVGGDIQAQGDVDVFHRFDLGCGNPSGYVVGGDIYGRNVELESRLGAGGTLGNSVGGNVYCNGGYFDLYNRAGSFAASTVNIDGSVYGESTLDMECVDGGIINNPRVNVHGDTPAPTGAPGLGVFSLGDMTLTASGRIDIYDDARRLNGSPDTSGNVNIDGDTSPLGSSFSVPVAADPLPPEGFNEVLMPECDYDYYREKAKEQDADAIPDGDHYYSSSVDDLDIPEGLITSSLYVIFVEGDLGMGSVNVPAGTKGVFVATGDVTLQEGLWRYGGGDVEFQIIAGGKVTYGPGFNMSIQDDDKMFIYAGHEDYDPVSDPVSVEYEMGWFRNIEGQITARGDILLRSNSSEFKSGLYNHSIRFKNPSVLGEAFRIPFTVKSWKEK